jgi:hypothetical protein
MKELKFNVEELHRGKWQPFMITGKDGKEVQKHVRITQDQADWNNKLQDAYKLRYVAEQDKPKEDLKPLRDEYEDLKGKKAYGGWSAEQLNAKIAELKQ